MIYFLTVNYYSKELVESLITSIANGIVSPYKMLIINNSPQEKDIHSLVNDRIMVIESGENLGFGRACNLGIDYVWQYDRTALVWLINPDTTLDSESDDYITNCFAETPNIAILGTQIRETSGKTWFTTGTFNRWTGSLKKDDAIASHQTNNLTASTQWVCGCSMILNLKLFKVCPIFDPHYFLYGEDADFCIRYAHHGYQVFVTQKVLVTHKVSSIIGRDQDFKYEHYTFGRLYFLKRNATVVGLIFYLAYSLGSQILLLLVDSRNGKGRWRGLMRFLTNRITN